MREIAAEQREVMAGLGHDRFPGVGHDRGARCAYRMALDHPRSVTRLAMLDTVPTGNCFRRADMDFSLGFWPWSFLAAPDWVPERLIAHDRPPSTQSAPSPARRLPNFLVTPLTQERTRTM